MSSQIAVIVEGGVVTSVLTNSEISVKVVNLDDETKSEQNQRLLDELTSTLEEITFET